MNNEYIAASSEKTIELQDAISANDNVYAVTGGSVDEARAFFESAVHRMQDVNHWATLCGLEKNIFQLIDKDGLPANRDLHKGDYVRFSIKNSAFDSVDDFEWAIVEAVKVAGSVHTVGEFVTVTLFQTADPQSAANGQPNKAEGGCITFLLRRYEQEVIAEIFSRKKINEETGNTIRNQTGLFTEEQPVSFLDSPAWNILPKAIITGRA